MYVFMKTETNQTLNHLIRDYIYAMGTSRTTLAALNSYIDAIGRIKCPDKAFMAFVKELNGVIRRTEPKVIPLVHLIEEFETEI
jgi:translation initiation factor eIF-2B subunit alpha